MLRLSMNELSTMRWSFEEDVEQFAAAGFDGIGIWRQKLSDIGDQKGVQLLARHGLQCSNLLWAGGFTGSDGVSFRESVSDAVEAIQTAATINAGCLVLYSGAWGGHTRSHARRIVKNALKELLPFAEEFGIPLAIEPMHAACGSTWTFLNSVEETLELIDPLENPFLKVTFDTYHVGMQDLNLQDLAQIAHRIAIVHLGDGHGIPDGEQDRCPLGRGCVPIREIIETLVQSGYDGFLDVELMGESVEQFEYLSLVKQSRDYMHSTFATL